jgi:hypothetical protein
VLVDLVNHEMQIEDKMPVEYYKYIKIYIRDMLDKKVKKRKVFYLLLAAIAKCGKRLYVTSMYTV